MHFIVLSMSLQVLWPYLLEFLIPEQYTRGFGMLTRCVHHIASKKRAEEAEDYELDFEVSGKIILH